MSVICGVDGCKGGWVAILKDLKSNSIIWSRVGHFEDIVKLKPEVSLVAVDIPIGLPLSGSRQCDVEARSLLGAPRGSSVFPAPIRSVLTAQKYAEACSIRFNIEGKKMSQQAFAIIPKVAEVDSAFQNKILRQGVVREVHPEVSFYYLAGKQTMKHNKKSPAGRKERISLLQGFYPQIDDALQFSERKRLGATFDDVIDAFVALWSAERILREEAVVHPNLPCVDSTGLTMEIVA